MYHHRNEMLRVQVHQKGSSSANGTSLIDYLDMSYRELVNLFGEPQGESPDGKVAAEWHLSIFDASSGGNGPEKAFVTIYNYKTGKNYSKDGLDVERIRDWHVGGKAKADFWALEQYIAQQRALSDYISLQNY